MKGKAHRLLIFLISVPSIMASIQVVLNIIINSAITKIF